MLEPWEYPLLCEVLYNYERINVEKRSVNEELKSLKNEREGPERMGSLDGYN